MRPSFSPARRRRRGPQPGALSRDDVWDQPGVTEASAYDIPLADYLEWIEREGIEAILCDQNYGFAGARRAAKARRARSSAGSCGSTSPPSTSRERGSAYDVVFSMTRAEQERYREMGLETPYVPWGCHPELVEVGEAVARQSGERR